MFEDLAGKGLLIHHWDTDGICSARLLLEKLPKTIVNTTPVLGQYFLSEEEMQSFASFDYIIIVDMALPEDNIRQLAKKSKILIFDHHLQHIIPGVFHHNPIAEGKNPLIYPSASWIVNEFLGNTINLFALLGIVGDHEKRIQTNTDFNSKITEFCLKEHISFNDLLLMVSLLDSSYKVGDHTAVEAAPCLLLDYSDGQMILQNEQWNKNLVLIEQEIAKYVNGVYGERHGIQFKQIHTRYNIISTVTRRIAWGSGKDTIVVNTGFFKDKDQIYVRSRKNLQPLIQRGKQLGYRCGGKAEVLGAVVPKEKTDSFVQEIAGFLSSVHNSI
jgi:single-stranded DNA-specific DHH superfamily exonuclease